MLICLVWQSTLDNGEKLFKPRPHLYKQIDGSYESGFGPSHGEGRMEGKVLDPKFSPKGFQEGGRLMSLVEASEDDRRIAQRLMATDGSRIRYVNIV